MQEVSTFGVTDATKSLILIISPYFPGHYIGARLALGRLALGWNLVGSKITLG